MSKIIKNEAIIIRKTKFSDSSLIVQLYTKENGKISALIKGARSSKSKIGTKIDLINHVEVVIYNKEDKDLQLVTQVNLINHFPHLRDNLEKIKYATAICELILKLIPDQESNERIFRGTIRILKLIEKGVESENFYFAQYLLFFIKEIGYELSFENCSECGNKITDNSDNAFSFANGIICKNCNQDKILTFQFSKELFNLFKCLTSRNNFITHNNKYIQNIIFILEKFLIYHNVDFKGIKSLNIL